MSRNYNYSIITKIQVGNNIYQAPNQLEIDDRLKRLVKRLIEQIRQKLSHSQNDFFFNYAYTNRDILEGIVKYEDVDRGGSHRNGTIYVGKIGFKNSTMGTDDDVMGTIFHEFMHYIAFKNDKYPTRFVDKEEGLIWTDNVSLGDSMQTEEEFLDYAYELFIQDGYAKPSEEREKYYDYPTTHEELSASQKIEFEIYIQESNLKPNIVEKIYRYRPSNLALDEINAHTKTLEADSMGLFKMSTDKINMYHKAISDYKKQYDTCLEIENNKNYTSAGYEK